MLGVTVWRRLLGVCDRTVIERVEFDEDADAVVASVRPRRANKQRAGAVGGVRRATTAGRAAGGGGRWTWVRSGRSWRPTRLG